jgi:hypothetical protein
MIIKENTVAHMAFGFMFFFLIKETKNTMAFGMMPTVENRKILYINSPLLSVPVRPPNPIAAMKNKRMYIGIKTRLITRYLKNVFKNASPFSRGDKEGEHPSRFPLPILK